MLLTLNIVEHEFDKIAPYLVMATKTASKHLKWAQVFQHVEHLWQFEGRSSKQRLNIWAQYIYWRISKAVFYGEYLITNYSMWGSKFVAGQGRTWPNRTFPVSTSKYSSWSQAIQVNRKNCCITLWDQTSIVCFQRQIYLIEQIDQSSVLDKHVDKIFSWKKEMAQIMQSDTGWPKVDTLDEKIKLSQTHWQILLATFSHFPPN